MILLGMGQFQKAVDDLQPLVNTQREAPAQLEAALAEAYLGLDNLKLARDYFDSASRKAAAGGTVDGARLRRVEQGLKQGKGAS